MALDLEKIITSIKNETLGQYPPVHLWHPDHVGEIDIVINEDMQWIHEGGFFKRDALVRLLASILIMEGNEYYLVTPQEKMKITVADVPFEIINMQHNDANLHRKMLITNTEDIISLEHPQQWELRNYHGTQIPYILVRNNLWARVSRSVFYQMIENAQDNIHVDEHSMYLKSGNHNFLLGEY